MQFRKWATVGLAAATAAPAIFALSVAPARAATGPYGGQATGDLVYVNAVNSPDLAPGLADVHIAPSTALVQSTGLSDPYGGKRSAARATNIDATALAGNVDLTGLLVKSEQTAPPSNAQADVQSLTGPIDAAPLATAELATASTHAVWGANDATCIAPGTPIATSTSTVLDANVLVGDPFGEALVSVVNGNGGAVFTKSDVGLVNVANQTNKGVQSTVLNQLTGVVLFKGSENEVTVNVLAPPTLSAVATGAAATSTVTYNQPIVQVIQGGEVTDVLNASNIATQIDIPPAPSDAYVLRLSIGVLQDMVKTDTEASGKTALLNLTLLDATETFTLATLSIAPMSVKSTVPAGGVECPTAAVEAARAILPRTGGDMNLTLPFALLGIGLAVRGLRRLRGTA